LGLAAYLYDIISRPGQSFFGIQMTAAILIMQITD